MKKPVIGIVPLWDETKNSLWMLPGYLQGIKDAGGIGIILPLTTEETTISQLAGQLDGVLFTGGHDVAPVLYHSTPIPECGTPCPMRDEMESLLFAEIMRLDKPCFGICRGIQIFNVLLGGTLYQDLPSQLPSNVQHQQSPPYSQPVHEITIVPNTPLHALLDVPATEVNSYHHQAICQLAPPLVAMAYAPDGLVEAVYHPNKHFCWAVQWHPEYMHTHTSHLLFKTFVTSCT